MAAGHSNSSVARLIVAASCALEFYEADDLAGALSALEGLHADGDWLA